MKNRVLIVKVRWNEEVNGQVKRVFLSEDNALKYMNESKLLDRYKGAEWILSDREISDFEPGLNQKDVELSNIDSLQTFIENTIERINTKKISEIVYYLEDYWSALEEKRLNIVWDDED